LRGLTVIIAALTLAVSVVGLLSGCGGGGGGGGNGGTVVRIAGFVIDAGTLQPIAGARVVVVETSSQAVAELMEPAASLETTTDANGYFELSGVPSGSTLKITKQGYSTLTQSVTGSGDVNLGQIELPPAPVSGTGNIEGIVTYGGQPAVGATVQAGGRTACTRSNGSYKLFNVPAGTRTVTATSADGEASGRITVTVPVDGTVTANIQLSIQPPPPPPI